MSFDHGHKYTLRNIAQETPLHGTTVVGLKAAGVEFVRIQWVDPANSTRYFVAPIAYFEKLLSSPRPGRTMVKGALGLLSVEQGFADGFPVIGEYIYVIDMRSIRLCPYAPGHASVMGFFQEKAPIQGPDGQPTVAVNLCPRTALRRMVEEARDQAGVEFLVGFETEFTLLKSTNPIEVNHEHRWCVNHALTTGSVEARVMEEIAHALTEAGVELQMYHSEAAPGQYEVVTGPLPPLESADALIHTRETITNIAARHGLRATLAPRLFSDQLGSSCHTHLSIHPVNPSPPATPTIQGQGSLPPQESSFIAGLLAHLPAITAFTLPQTSSYKRMEDGVRASGTYVSWGTENREAPVRLCNAASSSTRNLELRFIDGLANPYLALASILGAGTLGIKTQQPLTHADCSELSAAEMDDEARREAGITTRMSLSLDESRKALAADTKLQAVLGAELVEKYLSVNKKLRECMDRGTEEEAVTRLIENY